MSDLKELREYATSLMNRGSPYAATSHYNFIKLIDRLEKAETICEMVAEGAPHNWILTARRASNLLADFLKDLDRKAMEWYRTKNAKS